ncbi:hypothetical protein FKM82_000406 [Ascaphus truei]
MHRHLPSSCPPLTFGYERDPEADTEQEVVGDPHLDHLIARLSKTEAGDPPFPSEKPKSFPTDYLFFFLRLLSQCGSAGAARQK